MKLKPYLLTAALLAGLLVTPAKPDSPVAGFGGGGGIASITDSDGQISVMNSSGAVTLALVTTGSTTVNGSSGSYKWSMPVNLTNDRKVIIVFNGYTNASTSAIVFPNGFAQAPSVVGNATSLTFSTISTSGLTIPAATSQTGTVVFEGI